jgi:hypothetical protein
MLTRERAKALVTKASQFPNWGSYSKHMTQDELGYVNDLFLTIRSGNISVAAIVGRIARGVDPETGEQITAIH